MEMLSKALSWCQEQSRDDEYMKSVLILSIFLITITWWSMLGRIPGPPGPWGIPIVGNLPFLEPDLHRCFARLAKKYGPIMKVQLGSRLCVVISSSEAAKQVLKEHDVNFADRSVSATSFVMSYGAIDIGFSPYGDQWRMMRKLCVRDLLGHANLELLYGLRRKEVKDMVSSVYAKSGSLIDIGELVHLTLINIITSMMWGNIFGVEEKHSVTTKIKELVQEMACLVAEPNISDFFPLLSRFDMQGKARRMEQIISEIDQIFETVTDERSKIGSKEDKEKADFLQVMLQLVDQGSLKRIHLKALFLDMILAGTKTTSTTVEWAMAELLNNPKILKKAVDELDQVVGRSNAVEETHLIQLPYLAAITKEIFRLHPVAPLLLPHRARESCVVGGYLIPKGARVLLNAWAIQRDPKNWSDPLEFKPERFLCSAIDRDYKGNDFGYIPFGSGRRICAGISLGEKLVPCLVASLLHSFNWKLPQGTDMDMSEQFAFELKKRIPLVAIASPRSYQNALYSKGLVRILHSNKEVINSPHM